MAGDDKQRKLIQFLARRAWNPVLRANAKEYSDADQRRLERVQRKTEAQKQRYENYRSAGQVRQEFRDDLSSQPAKQTNADLRRLGLPTQRDVSDEFFELADALGVRAERGERRAHHPHPPHPWHKSSPEKRREAKEELVARARHGDEAALQTMRDAPQKWAREEAKQIRRPSGGSRGKGTGSKTGGSARKRT